MILKDLVFASIMWFGFLFVRKQEIDQMALCCCQMLCSFFLPEAQIPFREDTGLEYPFVCLKDTCASWKLQSCEPFLVLQSAATHTAVYGSTLNRPPGAQATDLTGECQAASVQTPANTSIIITWSAGQWWSSLDSDEGLHHVAGEAPVHFCLLTSALK